MLQILIFGASIAQGLWDQEGGWGDRLKTYLLRQILPLKNSKDRIHVFNLAIAGNVASDVLRRFRIETKERMNFDKTIFIFSVGTNDSAYLESKKNFNTLPKIYGQNVRKLFQEAKKYSSNIIFVGLTPVDETKTNPIPWNSDFHYNNESAKKYSDIAHQICNEEQVDFIEVFNDWVKMDYQHLLEEGLHPNSAGHQKIFETVRDYFVSHNIISSL